MGIGVAVSGTGSYLPERVFRNEDFPADLDTSDDWIFARTGIRERRFAGPDETSASMGLAAARAALDAADLDPADVDLVICATVTPSRLVPSTACEIQAGLGCRPVGAFDLAAACSGFIYGLTVACQFVSSGACRNVLVVGSDTLSRVIDFGDRNNCVLFGDGAGAAVLTATDRPESGLRSARVHADGTRPDLIRMPGVVPRNNLTGEAPFQEPRHVTVRGREVFRQAVNQMAAQIACCLDDSGLGEAGIDLLVPHQANRRIVEAACEQVGFPAAKVAMSIEKYGNTSAASVPVTLDEAVRGGRVGAGDTLLMVSFGGGLTWGSAVLTL